MNDLAATVPPPTAGDTSPAIGKVVAITSGKGGVGKTFISANLAAALARRGRRVLVLDADLGLANLDVVLNLYPKLTLHDVFTGRATLDEAILPAPGGFSVLLAGSGMVEYSRLTPEVRNEFLRIVNSLVPRYDVVLLDTGAGISDVVLFAVSLASEVLMVATPEPTSLTDAYATIKVLIGQQQRERIRLIVNQTTRAGSGPAIVRQLQQVLERFVLDGRDLPFGLLHLGDIPADPEVRQAVMRRQLLMQAAPGSPAAAAIGQIARVLEDVVVAKAS
jgi:flagellar biosynthesis protein FlhG